jgi:Type IV secretion system proteins
MNRKIILFISIISFSTSCFANWYKDIINAIIQQSGITNGILDNELSLQKDMLRNQKAMQKLMDQMNGNMTSHSGYGTYQFHDYQSYGADAEDWTSVVNMAEHGRGDGQLGAMIGSVSRDFPYDKSAYNRGINNPNYQRYFAVKSHTTIAARAASELDYNKIQQQISYQKILMDQIEKTKDIKAAMDLANRIQLESNLINLEILRQSALANQQDAINEQASVMGALSNAKFLTK